MLGNCKGLTSRKLSLPLVSLLALASSPRVATAAYTERLDQSPQLHDRLGVQPAGPRFFASNGLPEASPVGGKVPAATVQERYDEMDPAFEMVPSMHRKLDSMQAMLWPVDPDLLGQIRQNVCSLWC